MTPTPWTERAEELSQEISEYAARHDEEGTFVEEGYVALAKAGLFAAMVPEELGGGGAGMREICDVIRILGHGCGSTALAYSMHTHLVAATLWKHRQGQAGEALLRSVAEKGWVLVSTGAGDWLESNGVLERVEGGFHFTADKPFASGSPRGDVLVTSGRYEDPDEGPSVLHFPLSLGTQGVRCGDDWDTHGMRGTGSNTVSIEGAFVPDSSIALRRPREGSHPAFSVVSTVALPIFMSAYVGVAEAAVDLALQSARQRSRDPHVQYLAGELCNEIFSVRALWNAHVENANELDFPPTVERAARSVEAKTLIGEACIRTVSKAMELGGGSAYFRRGGIERLMRDVRAAPYHPLQPKRQHQFSGRASLGLPPV